MHTNDIDITPIDPLDRGLVDAWIDMRHAVATHDRPGEAHVNPALQRLNLLLWSEAVDVERHVARVGAEVVGALELSMPVKDNRHLVELALEVHPDHRRRGVGTALLGFAERRAAGLGRDTLLGYAVERLDGGPAFDEAGRRFAAARGYRVVDRDVHRRNDLALTDEEALARRYDEAWEHADGYELVQSVARAVPDDLVEGIAHLCERMYTDPPMGEELDIRPAVFDAARLRDYERTRERRAQMQVITAVRHIETGVVAGYTFILVNPGDDEHAWQDDTIVLPEHRGRRLGTILKIANQRQLLRHRPAMRHVHTWNAEANDRMIEINEMMGYRPLCRDLNVQKKLA
ncbi:GNAT family N-acetyltransferase [Glycomyces sp. A-F 0318]|uniref:GNAT family N-acetyltransferase n=1 Tax=Glycomyces amatae TaxID=2881355 RepID=UPI001E4ACB7C|nr:GNAT family N-acetyltransferase [Glycomyces amatae]MCD0446767.1 GNAT family N-acetyltransferase [Glycomyces amatae]